VNGGACGRDDGGGDDLRRRFSGRACDRSRWRLTTLLTTPEGPNRYVCSIFGTYNIRASQEHLKRLFISFLNAKNRDFGKKNYTSIASLNDHPDIAIFYSGFFSSKK